MYGVVSLLDEAHNEKVQNIWAMLKSRFGVGNPNVTGYPHFSYHIAQRYDLDRLSGLLERMVRETAVFTVHTAGLGIFTGAEPVIYIPVVRDPALTSLHQTLWPHIEPCGHYSQSYYAPANWVPHITLGQGDISPEQLGPVVQWLNNQNLYWTIPIHNFAILHSTGTSMEQQVYFPFNS
jgi:2'-5' RNA ligase